MSTPPPPSVLPRGIRNNNPGNMRFIPKDPFIGQTGQDKDGFGIYSSMTLGIRAAAMQMMYYHELDGATRICDYVSRWAPAIENNLPAYINDVCADMGFGALYIVQLPRDLPSLLNAIFIHENGGRFVSLNEINIGVSLADTSMLNALRNNAGV